MTYLSEDPKLYKKNIGLGYLDYFENDKKDDCPVKKCVLLNKGCKSRYVGKHLSIINSDTKGIFQIQSKNFTTDWSENFCYQCTNGVQTISADDIYIS